MRKRTTPPEAQANDTPQRAGSSRFSLVPRLSRRRKPARADKAARAPAPAGKTRFSFAFFSFLAKRKAGAARRFLQAVAVARYNFRGWRRNPRIFITFALAFILCFLLSDKAVTFAMEYDTTMQIVEAFVWTFGDSNSILLSSLLLVLLFSDMPFITSGTPFFLVRIDRKTWIFGQALYIAAATAIYLLFILLGTSLVCMRQSFTGNMWSETAAILGYSGAGKAVALPALVKTLEMSTPYACMGTICVLMLLYSLLLSFLMLLTNIRFGQMAGVLSVFLFSVYGFLLNPQTIKAVFRLPNELTYKANVAVGWASPLNHATYHMHNFGYDLLPRLFETYAVFGCLIALCVLLSCRAIRRYSFHFSGTERA